MLKPQPGKKQKVCMIGFPTTDETEKQGLKLKDTQAFWEKLLKNAHSLAVWEELWACTTLAEPYINVQIKKKQQHPPPVEERGGEG